MEIARKKSQRNEKNILLLEIRVSNIIIDNVSSGARSARRLNFNHGYVDLQSGNSARRYYVRDHLGSVRAVVNDGGTTLEADDYYPLGGPLPSATSSIQPEKYQGQDWNPAAGFNVYDFGARLYDPSVGLWLSQDPMAEKYYGVSPYAFCGDNPMVFVDSDGEAFDIFWDIANIAMDAKSLASNIKEGKVGGAIVDAIGLAFDVTAAAVPFVPGGVGTGIKAIRQGEKLGGVLNTSNNAKKNAEFVKNTTRGRTNEARVLKEIGLEKNTKKNLRNDK